MTTFTSTLNRIFLGAVPVVAAAIYLANSDRLLDTDEVLVTTGAIALGALLLASGMIGALRLAGTPRTRTPPQRSAGERIAWGALTLVMGVLVALIVATAARVRNVTLVEQTEWQRAVQADTPGAYEDYLAFVERTRPTRAQGFARLVRLNDTQWLFDMFTEASGHIVAATIAHDDASYRETVKVGTPQAFRAYLRDFNPGVHTADATLALDDAVYAEAAKAGTAAALRDYREQFSRGRHTKDARLALEAMYARAEADYDARVAGKADAVAAAGIKALLAGLREEDVDQVRVPVAFQPVTGLAGDAIELASKAKAGGAKVALVAPALSAEANAARESAVVEALNDGLADVVGDLFRLEVRPADETRGELRLLVSTQVRATGEVHAAEDQARLPPAQRTVHAGLEFVFKASVQVPGSKGVPFTFTVKPAPKFAAGAAADDVTAAMVSLAFEELRGALLKAHGLGG